MGRDVICAEGELSIAMNKTDRYMDFLLDCMSEYNKIMQEVPGEAMNAGETSRAMEQFALQIFLQKGRMAIMSGFAESAVKGQLKDMSRLDNFKYPGLSLMDFMSLLGSFL